MVFPDHGLNQTVGRFILVLPQAGAFFRHGQNLAVERRQRPFNEGLERGQPGGALRKEGL